MHNFVIFIRALKTVVSTFSYLPHEFLSDQIIIKCLCVLGNTVKLEEFKTSNDTLSKIAKNHYVKIIVKLPMADYLWIKND